MNRNELYHNAKNDYKLLQKIGKYESYNLSGGKNIEKKSNQFTWSILLKSKDLPQLHNLLKSFEINYKSMSSVSYKIDIDPYTMV